jgi:dihydroxyacetone kinase-like predicted kinase
VAAGRDELNRINVFPVPDGDTGTNMCLTLRAVAAALRNLGDGDAPLPLPHVAETMAQASVRGARGNSGMMLSQFLLGFREGIGQRLRINARELAAAIGRARHSMSRWRARFSPWRARPPTKRAAPAVNPISACS